MPTSYLVALALTLVLEVPVVAAVFWSQRWRLAGVAIGATTCTHLAMHFMLPRVTSGYGQLILWGELGALLVEAAIYALVARPRALGRGLVASTLANSLSYAVGLAVLPRLFGQMHGG